MYPSDYLFAGVLSKPEVYRFHWLTTRHGSVCLELENQHQSGIQQSCVEGKELPVGVRK